MPVFTSFGAAIFGAGTFMAGLTAAALQTVAGIAVSLIGKAMQGEPQPPKFGVQVNLQGGEDVPRSINLGWNCTAGSLVYHGSFGAGGTMFARVIALGDMPIRSLERVIVDGSICTLRKDQPHANYGWPVEEYRISLPIFGNLANIDHLWVKFYDGTQTAADPFLVSTFGSDPDHPYGPDRVGHGIPYAIVFARAPERNDLGDKPLFQGVPALRFETYGVRWYNPAQDSTAGGSGSQRWDNPATWGGNAYDFNPIVQLYNVMRGVRYNGQWLYGAQAIAPVRLPAANWIAAINAAQASIAGPSGNEPTYRAGGEIQVGAQVATTVEALLTAANARLVEVGGTYKIYVGPPGSPVMAFTDADILSSEEQTFSPFLPLADSVNGVDATFPNPGEGWNTRKAPPLLRPDLEPLDGNRQLTASVSLDLVPYKGQAQRLMKWALSEALRARRHTFVLGPEFRVLEPGDVVRWTSARNGYVDKLFRVDGVIYKSNLDVIVDLTEVDPSDYDWDQETDYRPIIDGPLTLVGPKPMPMQGWQVFPASITDANGESRRPTIEVRAASGVPSVERVRVQVRVGDDEGPLVFDSEVPYGDPWRWILQGQFLASTPYVVRGIFIGPPASEWSGWLSVTTPNIKLTQLDVDLSNVARDVLDQMGFKPRQLIEQFKQLGTLLEEVDRENYTKREALFREISVELEGLEASFTEIIEVALGPGGAIAVALESLYAAMGGNSSQVNIRWEAVAAPDGYSARYAIQAAVDDGSFRAATFFLDVPTDPDQPTRIVMMADQIAFMGADTVLRGLFDETGAYIDTARIRNLTADNIDVDDIFAQNASITGTLRVAPGSTGPGIEIQGPNNRILISD